MIFTQIQAHPHICLRNRNTVIAFFLHSSRCRHGPDTTGDQNRTSKVRLTVPTKDAVFTVNGTMKLISGERMQLSFLMPIIRTEVARMEVTPEEILLVDRMGKRYVRATRKELKDVLPKKADFAHLEKILFDASKPKGKRELTGKELGIPSLEKGRVELSGFSYGPFSLTPTELSSKYTEVELSEMLEMLMSL